MIKLKELYTFQDPYIAAASGLALIGDTFHVVADDELFFVRFKLNGPSEVVKIFEGILPEEPKARKKLKPDFESLVALPDQSVLCIPSGSKENRFLGAIVTKDNKVKEVSFIHIYHELGKHFSELNIEGAVLFEDKIRLFQRGNGAHHQNGIIDLPLEEFLDDQFNNPVIKKIKLGSLNGISLSFTDACLSDGLFWFLAVSENSESTYLDGDFDGAIIGAMDLEGNIHFEEVLDIPNKPEGLVVNGKNFYIVTDADDRSQPSKLFAGVLD